MGRKNLGKKERPTVISLYSGAGGLDVGLEQAGFDVRVALDFDHDSCETLRTNFKHSAVIEGDVTKITSQEILKNGGLKKGEVDLLVGGPPCQPFSKSAFWNGSKGLKDPRAVTLHEYIRILKDSKPKAFILENVFGLAYKNNQDAFTLLREGFKQLGYEINWQVINTASYGIPQIRQRLIILGSRIGRIEFPLPTHHDPAEEGEKNTLFKNELPCYVTAKEAFKGLKEEGGEVPTELKVGGKWGHLLAEIPPGDNYLYYTEKRGHKNPLFGWRSRYWSFLLKLSPNKPSWTIQAQPGPYVGPFHWDNRRLTLGERKRIQTFPDNYIFVGKKGSVQKQIGNAVPCLLGKVLGEAIKKQVL
ncbi:MAG: DNA cytosine methyltransferase [Candidatus Moranbacteria bacterium]|nr:DNA cytosine methyltransferase [Candidatus Moranbacteria bacterium]